MNELEDHLIEHGFDDLAASIWAEFLAEVFIAMTAAAHAIRRPAYWDAHTRKEGALRAPAENRGGALRQLPTEEGITCAFADRLHAYRVTLPPNHALRRQEVSFTSEARMVADDRTGRNSRRIDVMAQSLNSEKAPYVVFEAKLVEIAADITNAYLGPQGLGCFTLPNAYPSEHVAAMIAYVVDGEEADWSHLVEAEMARRQPPPTSQRRLRHSTEHQPVLWNRMDRPHLPGAGPLDVAHLVFRFDAPRAPRL